MFVSIEHIVVNAGSDIANNKSYTTKEVGGFRDEPRVNRIFGSLRKEQFDDEIKFAHNYTEYYTPQYICWRTVLYLMLSEGKQHVSKHTYKGDTNHTISYLSVLPWFET